MSEPLRLLPGEDPDALIAVARVEHKPIATFCLFSGGRMTFEDLGLRMHYTLTRPNVPDDALWRYFCGTCWKIVRERQHEAAALIQEGVV